MALGPRWSLPAAAAVNGRGRPAPFAVATRAAATLVVTALAGTTLVACGDSGARATASADPVFRSAEAPLPPPAETLPVAPLAGPDEGLCLSGDPDAGIPWSFAPPEHARTIPMQEIAELAPRDSARLAARLARAADGLPGDSAAADFQGLPVVIRMAWRVIVAPADTVVVATASRRLPIESAPREELLTIVAHPVSVPTLREPLRVVWSAREAGGEETLAPRDLVAAWTSSDTLSLLLVRQGDAGARGEVVRRVIGAWILGWDGVLATCRAP